MKKYKDKYDLHDYLSPLMLRALSKEHYSLTNISAKSLQVARRQLNIAYYDTIEHFQKVDEDYYIEQDGPQQIEPHGQIEFIQQNNMDHLNQILAEETYTTSSGETKQTHSLKYQ
jgi:hypothetical protein